jgi:hypothetical protein
MAANICSNNRNKNKTRKTSVGWDNRFRRKKYRMRTPSWISASWDNEIYNQAKTWNDEIGNECKGWSYWRKMKCVLTALTFVRVGNEESINYRKSTFRKTQAMLYTLTNELVAKVANSLFPPLSEKQCRTGWERLAKKIVVTAKITATERYLKFRLSWEQDLESCKNSMTWYLRT